ncbi:MAG: hypothetical protein ACLP0J_04525 [Solirubrobacteraceae bacterium]
MLDDRGADGEWMRVAATLSPFQNGHEMPDRGWDVALDVAVERLLDPPRELLIAEQPP